MNVKKIVICASGPSLCRKDIHLLKKKGMPSIAVNCSWMMDTSCEFLFAADEEWWKRYYFSISSPAEKWTCSRQAASDFSINYFEFNAVDTYNSGLVAIYFAMSLGAEEIYLLGFDCSLDRGVHWHGKHTGISNPTSYQVRRWITEFEQLSESVNNSVKIVNCSRTSSLKCFPVSSPEVLSI